MRHPQWCVRARLRSRRKAAPVFIPSALPGFLCLSRLSLCPFFFLFPPRSWPHASPLRAPRSLSRFALFRRKPRKKERGRLSTPQFFILDERREDATSLCDKCRPIGDNLWIFMCDRVSLLGNTQIQPIKSFWELFVVKRLRVCQRKSFSFAHIFT